MSVNPNRREANLDGRGGGLDSIISKTTDYDARVARQESEQQRDYYRGLSAEAPPANQTFGEVVSLEKTDLMFVLMTVQTLLLFAIWMETR